MIKNKDGGILKQQTERKKEREKGRKKYIDRVPYFANLLYLWAKRVILHYDNVILTKALQSIYLFTANAIVIV